MPARARPPLLVRDCSEQITEEGRLRIDPRGVLCPEVAASAQRDQQRQDAGPRAPLTQGRQFTGEPRWNVWADSGYTDSADRRFGLESNFASRYLTLGTDRLLTDRFVFGLNLTIQDSNSDSFHDTMKVKSNGVTAGPYIAYRVSSSWTLNGSFSVGWNNNKQLVGPLRSDYGLTTYVTTVSATGQYEIGKTVLRPGLDVSYTFFRTGAEELRGTIGGFPLTVSSDAIGSGYGTVEPSVEISHTFHIGERIVIPYVEPRVVYEYLRPGGGLMLTADLTKAAPKPWNGALRAGVRTAISSSMFLETSVGYLSFGQPNLRVGSFRLFASFGF